MTAIKSRPNPIDWEVVERDYRCGILSLREMANKVGGITESAIRKRAKRDDWTRDLNAKIHAKAKELVRKQEVRNLVRINGAGEDLQQVESMGQLLADVEMGHKTTIARGHNVCKGLLAELECMDADPATLSQRIDAAKKLVDTMKSVVAMEREAFGLTDQPVAVENPLTAFLRDMKRSTLPIVHDVPADDCL